MLFSPVCALLTACCTPEPERVQAELGARTSFRHGARVLESLSPVSPASHESLRIRIHAICGKVEHGGHPTRCFALVRSVAGQPHALLRAALLDQGWREAEAVTAISDGDPALPVLVRSPAR